MSPQMYVRQNLALAWPLAVNAMLVQSMLMIDTLLVAPLGEIPVAAMGIASAILMFALGIELAIGNGIQLLVGRAHGSKNQADLAVVFWVGLLINGITAMSFFCLLIGFGADIVGALINDAAIAKQVLTYLSVSKYVILFNAFTQVCTAFYNGRGNTKVTLKGYVLEIPINAVLSYSLIYGVGALNGLGLVGAAWGSLFAVLVRTIYFAFVLRFDENVQLDYPQKRKLHRELPSQLVEIFPISANFFVLFIGASTYQLLYAQLALASFVAITLIFPWLRIGTQLVSAWAQASAINISQALGTKQTGHLKGFVAACTRAALLLSLLVALMFLLLSQFIHLVYPNIEPETYTDLAIIAPLYILLPIVRGYNSVSGNILRALGESHRVLKLHLITQWVISLRLCALLILYFDVSVFWAFVIMPLEELLKTVPFYRFTRSKLRQYK